MLIAVASVSASEVVVHVAQPAGRDLTPMSETPPADNQLNPIAPELKEVIWGFGSFVVLAVLMRYVLYPRLRRGMDARAQAIAGGHDQAERATAAARSDVAQYESQVAAIRAEAQQRVDAARQALESERSERLAEANGRIAEKRAAAATEVERARLAAQGDVETAVRSVASRVGELVTGRAPDGDAVTRAVADAMGAGVGR